MKQSLPRRRDRLRQCPVCRGGRKSDPARCAACRARESGMAKRRARRDEGAEEAVQFGPYHGLDMTRVPIAKITT